MWLLTIYLILSVLFVPTRRTSSLALHSYIYIEHTLAILWPENKLFLSHRLLILSSVTYITLAMEKKNYREFIFHELQFREGKRKAIVLNYNIIAQCYIFNILHRQFIIHFFVTEKWHTIFLYWKCDISPCLLVEANTFNLQPSELSRYSAVNYFKVEINEQLISLICKIFK